MAIVKVVALLLVLDVVVQVFFARIILAHFERRPNLRARNFPQLTHSIPLAVETKDGLTIRGSLIRSASATPRGVMIFCHEYGGSRWSFQGQCDPSIIADFDLVTFDFRNHGESDSLDRYQSRHWLTEHEEADLQAVIDCVLDQPEWADLPVVLWGVSRGGSAALAGASRNPSINAAIVVGGFTTRHLAIQHLMLGIRRYAPLIEKIPRWHILSTLKLAIAWSEFRSRIKYTHIDRLIPRMTSCPVLMIAGERDTLVAPEIQKQLADSLPDVRFWIAPKGRHNQERDTCPDQFDEQVSAFLNEEVAVPVMESKRVTRDYSVA